MRRVTVLAAVAALVVAGWFAGSQLGRGTGAQDDTPAPDLAGHPAVGMWRGSHLSPDEYVVFHPDGTYVDLNPLVGVGVGVWRATGERTAEGVGFYHDVDLSSPPVKQGDLIVRITFAVDESGDRLPLSGTIAERRFDGSEAVIGGAPRRTRA